MVKYQEIQYCIDTLRKVIIYNAFKKIIFVNFFFFFLRWTIFLCWPKRPKRKQQDCRLNRLKVKRLIVLPFGPTQLSFQ